LFGLFRRTYSIVAPVSGKVIELNQVPDPTFAQKLVGDGVAVESVGDVIVAPADGQLVMIFRTNHAFAIRTRENVEVLVHVGIDTIELDGQGFERVIDEGRWVKAGEPVIKLDRQVIADAGKSLITPVIITNLSEVRDLEYFIGNHVQAGRDVLINYKVK
jgi:sugar PTS system EIIA component